MAEFLGDIAFMIEALVLGLGLVVLHFNQKESSPYLKWSGRLMAACAIFGMICTITFYLKYFMAGEFDRAYPLKSSSGEMNHLN